MLTSRSFFRAVFVLLTVKICVTALADDKKPAGVDIERIQCLVRVVDPRGKPVAGAIVTPYALCPRQEPQSHWGWKESRLGPRPRIKTGEDGAATFQVPKFALEKVEVGLVTWQVDHRDFIISRSDHNINAAPAEIKLQEGYRIAATAIDAKTKAPIKEHLYACLGYRDWDSSDWKLTKSGFLLSRTFGEKQFLLRVIALPHDGPASYSELMAVDRAENGGRVFLRKVPLQRGVCVQGKLDDAVPRPIKSGKVVAKITISPGEIVDDPNPKFDGWMWEDLADIRPDGTFEFASLPRGEVVQLFAVCDGWVSRTPKKEEFEAVVPWKYGRHLSDRVLPHVFALDEETIRPTIAMEPTVTCKVTVLNADGRPLPGANVKMRPSQVTLHGNGAFGGTLLGFCVRSSDVLRALQRGEPVKPFYADEKNPYAATTGNDGVALIRNLPGKGHVAFYVDHPRFSQPIQNNRRRTRVPMKRGDTTEFTLRMEPKGENLLGE